MGMITGRLLCCVFMAATVLSRDCAIAQNAAPYCDALKGVSAAGAENPPFTSITDNKHDTEYAATKLPLPAWVDCRVALDKDPTKNFYVCFSPKIETEQGAVAALENAVGEIKTCLGSSWNQASYGVSEPFVRDELFRNTQNAVNLNVRILKVYEDNYQILFRVRGM
jgi:hypothetical protein